MAGKQLKPISKLTLCAVLENDIPFFPEEVECFLHARFKQTNKEKKKKEIMSNKDPNFLGKN